MGLSVVEPKGDVAAMVAEMSAEMGIECVHIDPTKPDSARFNPMEGDIDTVAEATVVVLKGLFGKQEAFFATVQELSARNVTKLLKELHGDKLDITDVMNTLRDEQVLEEKVAELERRNGRTDLVHFFRSELLGSMREKYRQFVIGLRAQLENITSNQNLRRIMTEESSFNIDEHYEKGGVLAVNTALGLLRTSGDAFGQFIIMHLQSGAFRRKGTEKTRIPHFLIVDEYSRYINPDVEIFLNIAAEYRVAGIFAIQSLGQLEIESGKIGAKAMKRAILAGCRNKIVFGGIEFEDAKELADVFGKDKVIVRQNTYKNNIFVPNFLPDSYRDEEKEEYRFDPTDLIELPRFHYVHRLLKDGHVQQPGIAKGTFIPRDWKERREWEKQNHKQSVPNSMKKIFRGFNIPKKNEAVKPDMKARETTLTENIQKNEEIPNETPMNNENFMDTTQEIVPETLSELLTDQTHDERKKTSIEPKKVLENDLGDVIASEQRFEESEQNLPIGEETVGGTPSESEQTEPTIQRTEEPINHPTTAQQQQQKYKLKSKDNFW